MFTILFKVTSSLQVMLYTVEQVANIFIKDTSETTISLSY